MKIESSKSVDTRRTGKSRSKPGSGGSEFAQHLSASSEDISTPSFTPTSGIASADAIFAAQMVEDSTAEQNRKAKRTGDEMLNHLEGIRMGLLNGSIPKNQLARLAQMSRMRETTGMDPRLADILEEIDIRVQVELAKLSKVV